MTDQNHVVIELTEQQHRELLAIITRYSTNSDHWAISRDLRLAISEAAERG